jgi:hypothetical protein
MIAISEAVGYRATFRMLSWDIAVADGLGHLPDEGSAAITSAQS